MATASAKDVKAGGAFVELFTKSTALTRGLKAASDQLASWAKTSAKIVAGVGIGAIAAAGATIAGSIAHFTSHGDDIKKASDRLGIGAETLSALGYAAEQSGSDLAGLETGMRKLQKAVFDASGGGQEAAETFQTLGLSVEELMKMKPEDQWLAVADSLSKVENVTERNALAMRAFGKTGTELIPLLLGGSRGVRDLMGEAARVGAVVTQEQAEAAEKVGDAFERVWASIKGLFFQLGALLAPVAKQIEEMSFMIVDVVKAIADWVRESEVLSKVFREVKDTWDGLVAAVNGKDWDAALEILAAQFDVIWKRIALSFRENVVGPILKSFKLIEIELTKILSDQPGAKEFEDHVNQIDNELNKLEGKGPKPRRTLVGEMEKGIDEDIAASQKKALEDAKKRLSDLIEEAKKKNAVGDFGGFDFGIANKAMAAARASSSRGATQFASGAQFFGVAGGSVMDKLLKVEEKAAANIEIIAKAVSKPNGLVIA